MTSPHMWTWIAWGVLIVAVPVAYGLGWHARGVQERTEGKHRRTHENLDREWQAWRAKMTPDPFDAPEIRAKTGRLPTGASNYTPGDFRPQPVTHPGPDTRALVPLTDTGEIRAAGDAWIKNMRDKGMIT